MGERRGTKGLELWCKKMTEGYPGVRVDNMTTSWRDGLAFCAIIHHFRPDLIDFSTLNKDDVYRNNEMAFRVAEQYLGIPALLEPEDMVEYAVPDRLSILTYLSQFYKTFAVQISSPSRTVPKRPATVPDRGIVSPASTSPPTKMSSLGVTIGIPRREPCAKCGLPVFIAERLNVGKLLYHRTCFRCARCNSQLTLANYYETETQNQYCCETCPDEEAVADKDPESDKSVVVRSLSDEEKSAGMRAVAEQQEDDYSMNFETALEEPDDSSEPSTGEFTRARTHFINSLLGSSDDEEEDVPPVLPKSKPPDRLVDPVDNNQDSGLSSNSSVNNSSAKLVSDSSNQRETAGQELDQNTDIVTKENVQESTSLVQARMRLFQGDTAQSLVPSKTDTSHISLDVNVDEDLVQVNTSPSEENQSEIINNDSEIIVVDDSIILISDDSNIEQICETETLDLPLDVSYEETSDNTKDITPDSEQKQIIEDLDTSNPEPSVEAENDVKLEEYPDDLNPFGDDDAPASYEESLNPFGDDDDDDDEEAPKTPPRTPLTKIVPYSADKRLKSSHGDTPEWMLQVNVQRISINPFEDNETKPKPSPRKLIPAPRISLNPIWNQDEKSRSKSFGQKSSGDALETYPRTSGLSLSAASFGSSTSISSGTSTISSTRKKKAAPRPPIPKDFANAVHSTNTSPSTSVHHSPRPRKTKRAPVPPTSTPYIAHESSTLRAELSPITPMKAESKTPTKTERITEAVNLAIVSPTSSLDSGEYEKEKVIKDEVNRNRQSQTYFSDNDLKSYQISQPNKSTYGKWKRKKGLAPARPIPQKRAIKALPMIEVRRELDLIEIQQQGLEKQGVRLEQIIRENCEGPNSEPNDVVSIEAEDLILQLFEVVNEKNELCRRQAELMYLQRQQRLEEEHAEVEYQIRCLMQISEVNKTDSDKSREEALLKRLVDIVERRNEIVECLEMDRRREAEEDDSISNSMNTYVSRREENSTPEVQDSPKKKDKKKFKKKFKLKMPHHKIDKDKDIDEGESSTASKDKKKKKFNLF